MRLYNFGAEGNSLTKLWYVMCPYVGVIMQYKFWGHQPLRIWEGKKTSKNLRDLGQLVTNIFETEKDVKN